MTPIGGLAGALLLLAAQPLPFPAQDGAPPPAAAQFQFAPPIGQPMTYQVTTRRIARDGSLVSFSLVYALQWQRIGRGFRLEAVLRRIDSDARPEVARAVTLLLQPLVGEEMAYLVAADGSRLDLVDPEELWQRVTARIEAMAADAARPEARQVAKIIAALSAADRDRLATSDIRALVAPANAAIPAADIPPDGASVSIRHDGARRTIAKVERESVPAGAGDRPLEIDTMWTVDTATGLVIREQRQSWIVEAEGDARTLVEERVRALEIVSKD